MSFLGRLGRFVARRARRLARDLGFGPGLSARKAHALIAASGVFDPAWYTRTYGITADPLGHYLRTGAALGHNPSPLFWTAWYAARYPETANFGGGPLAHYLLGHGTQPNPVFDDAWYTSQAGDLAGLAPLVHFLRIGVARNLSPHPLFDTAWVRAHHPPLSPGANLLSAFLDSCGGIDPGPHFDSDLYLARYPDVAAARTNPLAHFLMGGVKDLRDPSFAFCTARYLRRHADARTSSENPLVHALRHDRLASQADETSAPVVAPRSSLTLTAIVPNYNHARFLAERLDSLFAQTVLPDEVIFLDDGSSDHSLAIAETYAAQAPMPFRIVPATANSGSPFAQWNKGLALASGDLVWLAEFDDRCAPTLVASLKPAFDDPAVTLAYAQSRPIAEDGRPLAPDYRDYTDDLSLDRWLAPYVADGQDEATAALAHRNTIPNGSAVLMRRSAIAGAVEDLLSYRQCGDWALYLACAAAGRIAFTPAILNDHRRHAKALTLELAGSLKAFGEGLRVRQAILERFVIPDPVFLAMLGAIAAEYHERMGGYLGDPPRLTTQPIFALMHALIRTEAARRFGVVPRTLALIETADVPEPPAAPPATFLAAVRPAPTEPEWPAQNWIEGGARAWIWSASALWAGNDAAVDPRRIAVLATLVELLDVTALHPAGPQSRRLAAAIAARSANVTIA